MSDAKLYGTNVAICDWHGRVQWISGEETLISPGDFAWQALKTEAQEQAKATFAKVVALQDRCMLEVENLRGDFFRVWLWPLGTPEMAVCVLSIAMPVQLKLLSERERETLELLAVGNSTKQVAAQFDVSISTVHTYLRRCRQKLGLQNSESLVGFAARFCHPHRAAEAVQVVPPPAKKKP